jgi:hypothetical protein
MQSIERDGSSIDMMSLEEERDESEQSGEGEKG